MRFFPPLLLACLLAFASTKAHASTAEPKHEDWYWTFGLGYSIPSYPSEVNESIDGLKDYGAGHFPWAYDLGFYWPIHDPNTLVGASLHGSNDSYSLDSDSVSLKQSGVYLSYLHSYGKEPGNGWTVRGDFGLAILSYTVDGAGATSSNTGLGLNAGVGYGFVVGEATRLIVLGTYSYRRVNDGNYRDFTITVGPMF